MKQERKNVLIVGLGLIGGSLAKTIKKGPIPTFITGLDTRDENTQLALQEKAIDKKGISFIDEVLMQDIIFLCTPVKQTEKYITQLANVSLNKPLIVTDVGSTKSEIVKCSRLLVNKDITFIGGHPMAGSHKSGFIAADENLFENAYYILTNEEKNNDKIDGLKKLLQATRANFVSMTAKEHDQITGMLSHMPHIIAAGLVNQAEDFSHTFTDAKKLAAGGFRDITRIASSSPVMWTDILLSNKDILLTQMDEWEAIMKKVKKWLITENEEAIFDYFLQAKQSRDSLPMKKQGAIPAFHDLFIDIPDIKGVIAEVTTILAKEEISIINIKVLEAREDIYGVLQITFKNEADVSKARKCIEYQTNYVCYEK